MYMPSGYQLPPNWGKSLRVHKEPRLHLVEDVTVVASGSVNMFMAKSNSWAAGRKKKKKQKCSPYTSLCSPLYTGLCLEGKQEPRLGE